MTDRINMMSEDLDAGWDEPESADRIVPVTSSAAPIVDAADTGEIDSDWDSLPPPRSEDEALVTTRVRTDQPSSEARKPSPRTKPAPSRVESAKKARRRLERKARQARAAEKRLERDAPRTATPTRATETPVTRPERKTTRKAARPSNGAERVDGDARVKPPKRERPKKRPEQRAKTEPTTPARRSQADSRALSAGSAGRKPERLAAETPARRPSAGPAARGGNRALSSKVLLAAVTAILLLVAVFVFAR